MVSKAGLNELRIYWYEGDSPDVELEAQLRFLHDLYHHMHDLRELVALMSTKRQGSRPEQDFDPLFRRIEHTIETIDLEFQRIKMRRKEEKAPNT